MWFIFVLSLDPDEHAAFFIPSQQQLQYKLPPIHIFFKKTLGIK